MCDGIAELQSNLSQHLFPTQLRGQFFVSNQIQKGGLVQLMKFIGKERSKFRFLKFLARNNNRKIKILIYFFIISQC